MTNSRQRVAGSGRPPPTIWKKEISSSVIGKPKADFKTACHGPQLSPQYMSANTEFITCVIVGAAVDLYRFMV
jgi:hypothetical protein